MSSFRLSGLFTYVSAVVFLLLTPLCLTADDTSPFRGGFELTDSIVSDMQSAGIQDFARISGAITRMASTDQRDAIVVTVPYSGGEVTISFTPNLSDLISPNHPARSGAGDDSALSSIATFSGHVHSDNPNDHASLTMYPGADGSVIEGTMVIDGRMYGIEPFHSYFGIPRSQLRSAQAGAISLVVSDVPDSQLADILASCAAVAAEPHTEALSSGTRSAAGAGGRRIEVAAVGDYEWYQKNGSSTAAAEGKMVAILNAANTHYERELGYGISLVASRVFSSSNDPYSGTKPSAMLKQFSSNKGGVDGDHAHLFTGRYLGGKEGGTIGIAWLDRTCSSNYNTGISQWLANGSVPVLTSLFMHELGHNAGSEHVKGSGVMHPSLNVGSPATTFSRSAKKQIQGYLNGSNGSCVTGDSNTSTYSVSGRVMISGSNSGLSGATVSLSGKGSTQTNSSGNFSFSGVSNGSYTLSATKSGYTIGNKSISISGSNKSMNLEASEGSDGAAPHIRTHPKSTTKPTGKRVTLKVKASLSANTRSSKGLEYQWYKNSSAIAGATRYALKLGALTTEMAGEYHVVVTGPSGATTKSSAATVSVQSGTESITVNFRPKTMKKPKPAGSKIKAVCLAKIKPASSRKTLLANASFEFRIGGQVVATQSGKKGKKYVHTLETNDNGQEFSCTFIDSNGTRHDPSSGLTLKVE